MEDISPPVGPIAKAGIFAMITPHGPLGMFADPLRDIELRRHRTLLQRTLPGDLEVLFLAQVGLAQSANRYDDLDHCHASPNGANPADRLCHTRRQPEFVATALNRTSFDRVIASSPGLSRRRRALWDGA
jgi:hypothetical protein